MAPAVSTSITRRSVVAGLALTAAPVAVLAEAKNAYAQAAQTMPEKSLYERLGGVFAIAAVVDHFSDAVVKNPIVGQKSKNPQLREWHTKNLGKAARCPFRKSYPRVAMMQSTQDGHSNDGARPLDCSTQWRILVQ